MTTKIPVQLLNPVGSTAGQVPVSTGSATAPAWANIPDLQVNFTQVGSTTVAGTPFIDFHSSGNANDYDSRIIASGGTTNGTGVLNFYSSGVTFNTNTTAPTFTAGSFIGNVTGSAGSLLTTNSYQGVNFLASGTPNP